jgi:hypothetical protein
MANLSLFHLTSNIPTHHNKTHRLLQIELICANIHMRRILKESSDDQHERRFHYSRRGCPNAQDVRGDSQTAPTKRAITRIQNRWTVAHREGRVSRLLGKTEQPRQIKKAGIHQHLNRMAAQVLPIIVQTLSSTLSSRYLYAYYTQTIAEVQCLVDRYGWQVRCMYE